MILSIFLNVVPCYLSKKYFIPVPEGWERAATSCPEARDSKQILFFEIMNANVFCIKAPMCISQEDADFGLEVFRNAVKNCK